MTRKIIIGLLMLTLIVVPLFAAACEEEVTPPAEEEEEGPPPGEEEEEGDWWDEFGEPEYGGELIMRASGLAEPSIGFDVTKRIGPPYHYWTDRLFYPFVWELDRDIFPFKTEFVPVEYHQGCLAESWEQVDPTTIIVNLREGVHWQDKEPVNGREFTADDVQYQYDLLLGTGEFTEPLPWYAGELGNFERVVATDTYTVEFRFKNPSIWNIYEVLCPTGTSGSFGAPREWYEQGDTDNWENVVGTGPWILEEFVPSVSLTFTANPNYFGYDERHPENQIPYITTFKILEISELATAMAALRTGQIDWIAESRFAPSWQEADLLGETNPDIQVGWWPSSGYNISFMVENAPFDDIRVRQALQMAINREEVAETYYGGSVEPMPANMTLPATGWYAPLDQWSTELQELFSYDAAGATALLAEAAADGAFEPNDFGGFDFDVLASSSDDLILLEIFQQYFSDIGVDMTIETCDMPSFMSLVRGGQVEHAFYEKQSGRMERATTPPLKFLTGSRDNSQNISDPTFDALYAQFLAADTFEEAKELFIELDMYVFEQSWAVIMFPTRVPILWQSYVKGYSAEQCSGEVPGYIAARLWIDAALKASMGR